jgi:ABC-type phosphate transport system substrate-binding protein
VKVIPLLDAQGTAVDASIEAIASGSYPLTRGLSMYVNRKPEERLPKDVEGFLVFALSNAGQREIHSEEGFVPMPEGERARETEKLTGEWTKAQASKGWKE